MKLQAEIARARALRADALSAAGVTALPRSTPFDVPDAGFGYKTSKVQRQVFGEARGARLTAFGNHASSLLSGGQHKAFEKGRALPATFIARQEVEKRTPLKGGIHDHLAQYSR